MTSSASTTTILKRNEYSAFRHFPPPPLEQQSMMANPPQEAPNSTMKLATNARCRTASTVSHAHNISRLGQRRQWWQPIDSATSFFLSLCFLLFIYLLRRNKLNIHSKRCFQSNQNHWSISWHCKWVFFAAMKSSQLRWLKGNFSTHIFFLYARVQIFDLIEIPLAQAAISDFVPLGKRW